LSADRLIRRQAEIYARRRMNLSADKGRSAATNYSEDFFWINLKITKTIAAITKNLIKAGIKFIKSITAKIAMMTKKIVPFLPFIIFKISFNKFVIIAKKF
jgi:hypothetical protein